MSENELAIARKARDATEEVASLRAENARLVEQLDALRAQSSGLAEKPTPIADRKCYRCAAVWVDVKERTVECQRCGAKLDPIDVLYEFVTKERNFLAENEHAKRELGRIKAEIEALKGDRAKLAVQRVECPRGCGKFVARSQSHAHGVIPHACYEARADLGMVPRKPEERWRVVNEHGAGRWCDRVSATRVAAKNDGMRVEEYTGPIGEKAERARDRAEHERQWRERMTRRDG